MPTAAEINILIKARDDASRVITGVGKSANGMVDALGKVGGAALGLVAVAAAGAAAAAGLVAPLKAASDLSETVNKAGVVFGRASGQVLAFGDTAAAALGQSKVEAVGAAATFGNLFTSMGLARKAAADMSVDVVKLASDLASFNNTSPTEALAALQSGLVGEIEPLRKYGVAINEATVAQKAMDLGLAANKDSLTEAAKVQARYALIMDQTKNAQGDFARTSEGAANSVRIIQASFEDFIGQIGSQFLPGIEPVLAALGKQLPTVLPILAQALKPLSDAFVQLGQRIADFIRSDQFPIWVARVGTEITYTIRGLGILAQGFADAFGSILSIVVSVGTAILQAFSLINPFVRHSPSLVESVETGFERIGSAIGDLPARVLPALRTTQAAMAALGEATRAAFEEAAGKAEAALLKQVALLGSGAVPAYLAARDALGEVEAALLAVNEEMERQQGVLDGLTSVLKGLEGGLKPLERAFQAARDDVRRLTDDLEDAKRAIDDLSQAPLTGENEADQKVFGLRNAMNILELQRKKLLAAGADPKSPQVKALDEEIKRHREALEIAELERKVNFDGQRNYIEQVAKAGRVQEQNAQTIIGKIVEQRQKVDELGGALGVAKQVEIERSAEVEKQKALIDQQRDAIAQQRDVMADLKDVQADLEKGAEVWRAKLTEVEKQAQAIDAALKSAATAAGGAGGGGVGLPKIPVIELPGMPGTGTGGEGSGEQRENSPLEKRLAVIQIAIGNIMRPLREFNEEVASWPTRITKAYEDVKKAFDDNVAPMIATLTGPFKGAWDALAAWWDTDGKRMSDAVLAFIDERRNAIIQAHKEAWNALKSKWGELKSWWDTDGKRMSGEIGAWLVNHADTLIRNHVAAWGTVQTAWEALKTWWNGDGKTWRDGIGEWLGKTTETQITGWKAQWAAIQTTWDALVTWWNGDGATWRAGLAAFFTTTIPTAIEDAKAGFTGLTTFLAGEFQKAVETAINSGPLALLRTAIEKIIDFIQKAIEKFRELKRQIEGGLPKIPNPFAGGGESSGTGASSTGVTVQQATITVNAAGGDAFASMRGGLASMARERVLSGAL